MSEMTNRPLDLDAALEDWLRGAPRLSADQVVASALADVTATRQERANLFALDATVFRVGLLAAGLAALAIELGLGLGPRLVVTNPSPSPSDRSSPAPSPEAGFVVHTVEDGGYEVSLPSAWELRSDLFGEGSFFGAGDPSLSVTGWGQAMSRDYQPLLTISVGDTDGRIRMCQAAACPSTFDVGTTIEDMDAAITTLAEDPGGFPGMTEVHRDLTLDGEPALYVGITSPQGWTATPQYHHVFAVHDGRPVVVAFDHWTFRGLHDVPPGTETQVIDSFRFLDDPAPASTPAAPEPDASVEWQTFAIPEVGLELDAPSDWHLWPRSEVGRETRLTGPTGAIFIRVANAGGAFFACGPTVFCRWAPVSTIDDLVDIVEREYRLETQFGQGALDVERRPIEIDGVEATFVTIRPSSSILAPRPGLYAMAIHEGQAVLFTWSNWDDAGGMFGEILRSVRFVDR